MLIMSSAAYQQSSTHPQVEKLREMDSKNSLLAYFPSRRLAAEEIRDALLATTGELNRDIGGPAVFPEINWEVAFQPRHTMGTVAPAYQPSHTRRERHRRTLYAFRYRTLADPMLETFNRPGSELSCERRDETTVTPQAFALFNSEFVHNRALALAAAIDGKAKGYEERLSTAFRAVYDRPPASAEVAACAGHYARALEHHRANPPKPQPLPQVIQRHMTEELTGEQVSWEEFLPGMNSYERDLMPWEVSPETRALGELCLVFFNSNEFLYLR